MFEINDKNRGMLVRPNAFLSRVSNMLAVLVKVRFRERIKEPESSPKFQHELELNVPDPGADRLCDDMGYRCNRWGLVQSRMRFVRAESNRTIPQNNTFVLAVYSFPHAKGMEQ
jgi:hypothetical protein